MQKFDISIFQPLKKAGFLLMVAFFSIQSMAQVFTVDSIMRNGDRTNRANLVYLSDGYLVAQLPTFITNSTTINNALFAQSPFSNYKNYFNSFAIRVPSAESGAKHPGTASDEGSSGGQPVANPNTNFGSTFDYFSIHRLLVPQNGAAISSALASNLPNYSQVMIVVNSPYYGGSGGVHATASADASSAEVAIHEIGHSFAGLADEYWAGDFYAAEKPNMTANSNPATVKWKNWVGLNSIGVYPYGSSGTPANWYRPHQTCKMQYLNVPFCSVCTEKFIDVIHTKVNMIDAHLPAATAVSLTNANPVDFSITAVQTIPSTIGIKWYLNGSATPFATNQFAVSVPYASFNTGNNTVRAEVTDNTPLSKSYLPGVGYINNLTWTVNNTALPIHLLSFTGSLKNKTAILNWEIDSPEDLQNFELQKSGNGENFSPVGIISAMASKKHFDYADEKIFARDTYYRLKMLEKNGTVHYSNIIRLQNAFDKYYYKVYQHGSNNKFHLSVGITQPEKLAFTVTDVQGRVMIKKDFGNLEKQLEYDFDLSGKPAGAYFMTLYFNKKQYSVPLMVQ